ncbi:protein kinase subdomain-containing protein [Trichophyton equinum CBS 127.97]|uniref:Protein kinase subdomain-containing protein n=1 Tax=Trichophyton equinum (strain ATCC MYA-4606 / CBS 127.97) TaxID=559882 RepID=F2PGD7_TRIEC|nr:protein kinase subdomain-containing protein [Trichophyton equinum CBS 127.97]
MKFSCRLFDYTKIHHQGRRHQFTSLSRLDSNIKHTIPQQTQVRRRELRNNEEICWNSNNEFFQFTRGRFVINEKEQLSERHVRFDIKRLAQEAARSVGAKYCIDIQKCADGMFNKAYIFTLDNDKQVIGKVPNPNAGIPYYTTASEVATLDFMRNVLKTPAPEVYAWNSRKDKENNVGAEYIIMEKFDGIQLGRIWLSLDPSDKMKIFLQIFEYQRLWTEKRFNAFGSLYYRDDLEDSVCMPLADEKDDRINGLDRFAIGPATGREWSDAGRSALHCDRGPWNSLLDYRTAVGHREKLAIETGVYAPKQLAMLYGPGLYRPTQEKRIDAVQSYLRLVSVLLPSDQSLTSSHIWHDDLHSENIFVCPKNPTKIIGIIDWQSTQISPLFDHCMDPAFLDYDGSMIGDSLKRPELPENIKHLSKSEKNETIKEYLNKSVMVAWRMLVKNKNPSQYAAMMFENTTKGYLLLLSRRLHELGEPQFRALSLDLQKEWLESNVNVEQKFPLSFSPEQEIEINADRELSALSSEAMRSMQQRLGRIWPDKALAEHDDYQQLKTMLLQIKEELASELVKTPEERAEFEKFWPLD